MSKTTTPEQAAANEGPASFELTLDEFCTRLSSTDKRVEMIAGFHYVEKQAGRVKATEEAFAKRYADFQTIPA